ncbi:Rhodanese domain containing protein [Asbolus verrucosus]|uniref:Rhodanese domain containing protein n=1 Tax=Asbolus verrucosus TaxID=1661398 RepID=A0A482VLI5_ASBVE|nr:Rhodanese domain containing protein [Asbolus verrucosus]
MQSLRRFFPFLKNPKNLSNLEATFEEIKSLKSNKNALLIDVREPSELQQTGVIPESINIPLPILENVMKSSTQQEFRTTYNRNKPNMDTPLIFHCKGGKRSQQAVDIATKLGYLK